MEADRRNIVGCVLVTAIVAGACASGRAGGDPGAAAAPDAESGRWLVQFDVSTDPIRRAAVQAAQDLGQSITERLRLPRDITVRFADCDQEQTTWSRERREVLLCDGTVRGVAQALQQALPVAGALAGQDATGALVAVTRFLLARQLGKAFVDLLAHGEPPAADREADEFAALLLLGDPKLSSDVRTAARVLPLIPTAGSDGVVARADRARGEALECLARTPRPEVASECGAAITARLAWWERRLEIIRLK